MSEENKVKAILGDVQLNPMPVTFDPGRLYMSGKTDHRLLLLAKGLPVPDMPCTDAEISVSRKEQLDLLMDTDVQHAYLTPIFPHKHSTLTSDCRNIQQTGRMPEGGQRRGEVDVLVASTPASKSCLKDVVARHLKSRRKDRE